MWMVQRAPPSRTRFPRQHDLRRRCTELPRRPYNGCYVSVKPCARRWEEHAWRHPFAVAIPRWTIYVAKLLVGGLLLVFSSCVLAVGMVIEGVIVYRLRPDLGLTVPIPGDLIMQRTIAFTVASLFLLAVQIWVAMRWSSFVVALGVGISENVAVPAAFAMLNADQSPSISPP